MTPTQRPISQNRRDILRAFLLLERETGRTAFKSREVWQQVPHIKMETLRPHVNSRMNNGLGGSGHKTFTNEIETVGQEGREKLYSLSSFGRQQIKDLGLDKD